MSDSNLLTASVTERLKDLPRHLETQDDFADVLAALAEGNSATCDGVWGSSCALLAASLAHHAAGPLVVVLPHPQVIDDLLSDVSLFSDRHVLRFPAWESDPGEHLIDDDLYADRLRVLKLLHDARQNSPDLPLESQLAESRRWAPIIVTSIQSLLQPSPEPAAVQQNTKRIHVGDNHDIDNLMKWLVSNRFHSTTAVELPGEFSSRGGILDIFAPDWDQPVRVEFFGDEIESLRRFDIASQRSLERLQAVDITMLRPTPHDCSLFAEHLPNDARVLLLEPNQIQDEGKQYLSQAEDLRQFHNVAKVLSALSRFPSVSAAGIGQGMLGANAHLRMESVERFSGEVGKVRGELDRVGEGHEVFVIAPTDGELERLAELFKDTRLAARGQLNYAVGDLTAGFCLTATKTLVLSANDLFLRGGLRRMARRRQGKAIDSFLDLREGDLVVHLSHGIGRYRGLKLLDKDRHVEEHLEIEFHGGTKVYVPATKIELVQKYVGGARARPALARIGGKSWVRQKQAAEAAVVDLAAEMLDVQAERATRPGIAFAVDSEWQREFDASFPYQETPDQLSAIAAIKQDMGQARPMDRLICGDVGFGKTELAMRAAFKAVDNGYQVAVLTPTTILAEQHYHTFRARMSEFPVDIARLSRFCSAKEQKEIIAGLASGRVDVVIGTHRLASQDVAFDNLGLLIIDEEQRFGVEVKDRLKSLRTTVDVLTLSATPIPRTLHMSLVGVRNISNLETPPADRLSVETRMTRWDEDLIRHAVLRELNRGGQIFFVHNRVQDIRLIEHKLQHIVPEARLRIAHGQMPERDLEQVMIDFVNHKFDLLLATTIVESGLDIPNANTIFIHEADRYGLADMHQLRGRVGRYKHRAYCYLLIESHKHITPLAAKRLRAIEEYSEMGAGFAIAMRDLEIRGAGNILGTQQSGHIATVGYELYCQLLENAVRKLQHKPPHMKADVDIDLPVEAYLPAGYVTDMRQKIDIYRRLCRVSTFDEIEDLQSEMVDRFGDIPAPVAQLFELARLRMNAAVWQIHSIFEEDGYLVFRYANRRRIEQLARDNAKRLRIVDEESAYAKIPPGFARLDLVKTILQKRNGDRSSY